jgi:hypothetical protein
MPAEDILDFRDPTDRALYRRRVAAELRYETLSTLRGELARLHEHAGSYRTRTRWVLIRHVADARMAEATGLTIEEAAR